MPLRWRWLLTTVSGQCAGAATAPALVSYVQVPIDQWVPIRAMRLGGVARRSANVLRLRYGFKMAHIHALSVRAVRIVRAVSVAVVAHVVDLVSVWNGPIGQFVGYSMREQGSSGRCGVDDAVTSVEAASEPRPTIVVTPLFNARPETLLKAHAPSEWPYAGSANRSSGAQSGVVGVAEAPSEHFAVAAINRTIHS